MSEPLDATLSPSPFDRRHVLRVLGTSAGALFLAPLVAGCQSHTTGSPPSGPVGGIKVADLRMNGLVILSSNVAVGRDSQGVYAMSSICTHAGCLLEDNAETIAAGLACPCHGSTFDGNGQVTGGPARQALQHYQVTIASDGSITVDGSSPVAADVRQPTG